MSLMKYIQSNDLIKLALVFVGIYLIMQYLKKETLENVAPVMPSVPVMPEMPAMPSAPPTMTLEVPPAAFAQPAVTPVQEQIQMQAVAAPKETLQADDLLPKYDEANDFAQQNPVSKLLQEKNFLISGYHVGVNTVMQSNKIPYHDLRSVPPIPKESLGPFMNSSYETPVGANRRQLEVGY
jgi:hypothetical protein